MVDAEEEANQVMGDDEDIARIVGEEGAKVSLLLLFLFSFFFFSFSFSSSSSSFVSLYNLYSSISWRIREGSAGS